MISIANAAAAYANTAQQAQGPGMAPRGAAGDSFADVVKDALSGAESAVGQSEQQSLAAAAGTANLTQVATAVTNADVALQTVIAVRDKVIQAYEDVLKMPM